MHLFPRKPLNKTYLVCFVVSAVLLGAAVASYDVAFYLKALTQFIASGKSAYKDYFFLVWAAGCFLLLSFPPKSAAPVSPKRLCILIGALALLNFLSHVYFVRHFDLNFGDRHVAVSSTDMSSHKFSHTHTMKPMLMPFVNFLHLNKISEKTDPGGPFYNLLPHGFFYLGIGLVAFFLFDLFRFLRMKEQEWTNSLRWPFLIVFIIASYAVTKTFFDGGPLSPEFLTYTPILLILLFTKQTQPWALFQEFAMGLGLAALAGTLAYAVINPSDILILLRHMGILYVFPVAVFLLTTAMINRSRSTLMLSVAVFAFLAWTAQNYFWALTWKSTHATVPAGRTVFLLDPHNHTLPYPVFHKDTIHTIHAFAVEKEMRTYDMARRHSIPAPYDRIKAAGIHCMENASALYSGKIISAQPVTVTEVAPHEFAGFNLQPCATGPSTCYTYTAEIGDCLPNGETELIPHHLRKMGFQNFILTPLEKST